LRNPCLFFRFRFRGLYVGLPMGAPAVVVNRKDLKYRIGLQVGQAEPAGQGERTEKSDPAEGHVDGAVRGRLACAVVSDPARICNELRWS
jgi:hypothetical protein